MKRPEEQVTYDQAMSAITGRNREKVDALFAETVSTAHDLQYVWPVYI